MCELSRIPNVGKQTEKDLRAMGYTTVESLKGKSADLLYAQESNLRGFQLDRCQLYLLRAVEYFVNTENPDLEKCKWWLWKDDVVNPSPCGAVCVQCACYPSQCPGCRKMKGKVFWAQYMDWTCCAVYNCCVNENSMMNCSRCEKLPCECFVQNPTLSVEENAVRLRKKVERLREQQMRND